MKCFYPQLFYLPCLLDLLWVMASLINIRGLHLRAHLCDLTPLKCPASDTTPKPVPCPRGPSHDNIKPPTVKPLS